MRSLVKIVLLLVLIIAANMVLLDVFHAKDYIATAVSVAIAILAAVYESKKSST